MSEMKEAVATAAKYLADLFKVTGIQLEEIEKPEEGSTHWLITFSFTPNDIGKFMVGAREYKQVEIDHRGEPIAVRIRKI